MKNFLSYLVLLLFFLISGFRLSAQDQKTKDSLLSVAFKAKTDSNSVLAVKTLIGMYFNTGNYDSALKYGYAAIDLSKKINDKTSLTRSYFNLGSIYTNLYNQDSLLYYNGLAEKEAIELKDTFLLVHCYSNYAAGYRKLGDYKASLNYAIRGAEIAEHSTDSAIIKILPMLYHDIGATFKIQNQYRKTIEYGEKALEFTNYPGEQRYRILILLEITDAYLKLKQLEEAGKYISTAVKESDSLGNMVISLQAYNTQAIYFSNSGNSDLAIETYKKVYNLCDSVKDYNMKTHVANNIAIEYWLQKQYDKAKPYAEEANSLSLEQKQFTVTASSFDVLKRIATAQGDYKAALRYANLFKRYSDSTINQETQNQIVSLEKKYQTEKKEREIAELTAANAAHELTVARRNRLIIAGGLGALLLLLTFGFLYRNSKQKQLLVAKENALHLEQIEFLKKEQQVLSLRSMVNGQETERTRIARDLHDGLGGIFSTIKMYLSTLQHEQEALQHSELFNRSFKLIDTASEEIRRIAHNMMPEGLMKLGLVHALEDMCTNISAAKQLDVKLQTYGMEQRMNISTEIMLYRIVQELLTNIIKHAQATQAIVQFNRNGDRLSVTVEDNGRGFNLKKSDDKEQTGLETVKSRVNYLNGQISIDSESDIGTTVLMEFLVNDDPETSQSS
ncbi:MAG: sensor histidine kinase [Chitinophagaceae bacterium]|nr:sensor histidine kinase [Chitinophagaceae bacterium]